MKICLDAGHFAKNNQSPVVKAYYESDFAWKFHLLLKEELEKYGFEIITTRAAQAKDLGLEARGRKSAGTEYPVFPNLGHGAFLYHNNNMPPAACFVNSGAARAASDE